MMAAGLRERLIALFSTWVDQDEFGPRMDQMDGSLQDAGVHSVRQFLEELLRSSAGPNALI